MKLTAFFAIFVFLFFTNYETIKSDNELDFDSNSDTLKRERLINLLKRRLANDVLEMEMRDDDSEENKKDSDEESDRNNGGNSVSDGKYKSIGMGITIPLANGESVNICEGKYIAVAATVHDRIRDLLVSACSGASGIFGNFNQIRKY